MMLSSVGSRLDPAQVIKLKLEVELKLVSLELIKGDIALIKGVSSGNQLINYPINILIDVTAGVKLTPHKVLINTR